MEFSIDFEITKENKKVIENLLKQKGVKHYVLETKDKDKLDLIEYKDYQELIDNWNKLEEFIDNAIYNSWYLYNLNTVCQYEDGIRAKTYENVFEKMKEILSKIEKR